MKALIIDDEIDICFLLSSVLKQKNLDISIAHNLNEGMGKVANLEPEVIFLDNYLPDGKGLTAIQNIKQKSPGSKIIMITAFDTAGDRNLAFQMGADSFMGKPFTRDLIYKTLEDLHISGTGIQQN